MFRQRIFSKFSGNTLPLFSMKSMSLPIQWNNSNKGIHKSPTPSLYESTRSIFISSRLDKYNRKRGADDIESDSEDEADVEFKDDRDSKVIRTKINSLRSDLVLKAGLGIARNKIENIFYESRIRLNGKKMTKKSVLLNEGDEIDVIRGFSQQNPCHLVISRVIILSATAREEGYSVNLRRYKSFLIENYSGTNAYK